MSGELTGDGRFYIIIDVFLCGNPPKGRGPGTERHGLSRENAVSSEKVA